MILLQVTFLFLISIRGYSVVERRAQRKLFYFLEEWICLRTVVVAVGLLICVVLGEVCD